MIPKTVAWSFTVCYKALYYYNTLKMLRLLKLFF